MKCKHIIVDETSDDYLQSVIRQIQSAGVTKVSRADALRFIIKMNQQLGIHTFRRSPKKKREVILL